MTDAKPPMPPTAPQAESPLSEAQIKALMSTLSSDRVVTREGQENMEAYDIRATLNKAFGFGGWSGRVVESWLVYERLYEAPDRERDGKTIKGGPKVDVAYRVRYELTVWVWRRDVDGILQRHELATYAEEAMGDAAGFPPFKRMGAHDFALKTAESQAMKRCAINFGDQFGLSLYKKRDRGAPIPRLTASTLVGMPTTKTADETAKDFAENVERVTAEHSEHLPVVPEREQDWADQAIALAGDEQGIGNLYNEARKAKVSPTTLAFIKAHEHGLPDPEGIA